jgi:hypothetical protein
MVLRISNIALNYGTKSERIFLNPEKFEIKDERFKPSPMERWSNRKKRKMIIPAFEGDFCLEGDLKEIYPYLELLKIINLGKSVSFGLGKLNFA